MPAEGDRVHFDHRFAGIGKASGPAVDACAVDRDRVALACTTVYASEGRTQPDGLRTGDDWLVVEHPGRVTGVLLLPHDQSQHSSTCEEDAKDGGSRHPPEPARAGDQL